MIADAVLIEVLLGLLLAGEFLGEFESFKIQGVANVSMDQGDLLCEQFLAIEPRTVPGKVVDAADLQ